MKYVIMIGDGMSDYPLPELNNHTPLEVAKKPNMDKLAEKGCSGLTINAPKDLPVGSDVANMSIFGYDPHKYYTGRGPIEAANQGIETVDGDVVFRCNLITEKDGKIVDFTSGHISTEEATELMEALNKHFKDKYPDFKGFWHHGLSYRHLFVYHDINTSKLEIPAPHDIVDEDFNKYLDFDTSYGKTIKDIMFESKEVLKNHPVNLKRVSEGKNPANMIWLWGQGTKPSMPAFKDLYNIDAAVITGVDLLKGLAIFTKLNKVDVPGATGYFDTDYEAKAEYACNALKDNDLVIIHVEAPDEAGHAADIDEKIKAIERIDKIILGKILKELPKYGAYKVVVLPDHPTPVPLKTHSRDLVPITVYSSINEDNKDNVKVFSEKTNSEGSLGTSNIGCDLIKNLLNNTW
ncbi:MAG: cofactor-independent phosphoglycerate mutase [Methanobacteriaceae archaeon]|nr:cofactor-independent phosphoglycerate mutase [Methanobacteriaceae archaeon]